MQIFSALIFTKILLKHIVIPTFLLGLNFGFYKRDFNNIDKYGCIRAITW